MVRVLDSSHIYALHLFMINTLIVQPLHIIAIISVVSFHIRLKSGSFHAGVGVRAERHKYCRLTVTDFFTEGGLFYEMFRMRRLLFIDFFIKEMSTVRWSSHLFVEMACCLRVSRNTCSNLEEKSDIRRWSFRSVRSCESFSSWRVKWTAVSEAFFVLVWGKGIR